MGGGEIKNIVINNNKNVLVTTSSPKQLQILVYAYKHTRPHGRRIIYYNTYFQVHVIIREELWNMNKRKKGRSCSRSCFYTPSNGEYFCYINYKYVFIKNFQIIIKSTFAVHVLLLFKK